MTVLDDVLALVIRDSKFMRDYGTYVSRELFAQTDRTIESAARQIAGDLAVAYWERHAEPIGSTIYQAIEKKHGSLLQGRKMDAVTAYVTGLLKRKRRNIPKQGAIEYLRGVYEDAAQRQIALYVQTEVERGTFSLDGIRDKLSEFTTRVGVRGNIFSPVRGGSQNVRDLIVSSRASQTWAPSINVPGLEVELAAFRDLAMVLAPYKSGKSIFAMHLARAYAAQGLHVMHFDLENREELCIKRYLCSMLGVTMQELATMDMDRLLRKYQRGSWRWRRGNITAVNLASELTTTTTLTTHIERAMAGPDPIHAVIIDYDDKIAAPDSMRFREKRIESNYVYQHLKLLAEKHNIVIWVIAQAVRSAVSKQVLGGADVAENIQKVRDVACVLTIGRSTEPNHVTITVSENRNDASGGSVVIPTDFSRMQFVDTDAIIRNAKTRKAQGQTPQARKTAFS